MESEVTNTFQEADAAFDEDLSTAAQAAGSAADSRADRLARVNEYEDAGLAKDEPLEACLAGVMADLLRYTYKFGIALDQSLGDDPTPERLRQTERARNDYLRLTRQIERYAQLEERAAQARRKAAAAAMRSPLGPLSPRQW